MQILNYTREGCINDPALLAILIAANLLIFFAYTAISGTVAWLLLRARKVPFPAIWALTGGFIISCGGTHLCAVLVFFRPAYNLEAAVCAFTAVISTVTAILVYRERHLLLTSLADSAKLGDQLDAIDAEIR